MRIILIRDRDWSLVCYCQRDDHVCCSLLSDFWRTSVLQIARRYCRNCTFLDPIAVPIIIHRRDLERIAPMWLSKTIEIREDMANWPSIWNNRSASPVSRTPACVCVISIFTDVLDECAGSMGSCFSRVRGMRCKTLVRSCSDPSCDFCTQWFYAR